MTPPHSDQNITIATTDPARLGKPSSKGDLAVMSTLKPVVIRRETDSVFHIQAPLMDSKGNLIGMVVEVIPISAVENQDAALKAEENLRNEVQRGIPNSAWMFEDNAK